VDRLGHGTAVMAAIQEKATQAEYFAVQVFHNSLRSSARALLAAIEWTIEQRMDIVNLSLGTHNTDHSDSSAGSSSGRLRLASSWCPPEDGWQPCFRDACRACSESVSTSAVTGTGTACRRPADGIAFLASGYPRPAPGIPKERQPARHQLRCR